MPINPLHPEQRSKIVTLVLCIIHVLFTMKSRAQLFTEITCTFVQYSQNQLYSLQLFGDHELKQKTKYSLEKEVSNFSCHCEELPNSINQSFYTGRDKISMLQSASTRNVQLAYVKWHRCCQTQFSYDESSVECYIFLAQVIHTKLKKKNVTRLREEVSGPLERKRSSLHSLPRLFLVLPLPDTDKYFTHHRQH